MRRHRTLYFATFSHASPLGHANGNDRRRGNCMRRRTVPRAWQRASVIGASIAIVFGLVGTAGASSHTKVGHRTSNAKRGGHITVLEANAIYGAWPGGFDPATTTTGGANQSEMDAIYGDLIEMNSRGQAVPDLATSVSFANNGKSLLIHLRKGVTFSDGTPFDASAVVWNYKRDFASSTCSCKSTWPVQKHGAFKAINRYTVRVDFSRPYAPAIDSLHDEPMNWIASPAAFRKMGEQKFKFMPVGAGPFVAVKDVVSSKFVVRRNVHYWQPGHPFLNYITFDSIASGEPTLEAMEAGQAQVAEGMAAPALVPPYKSAGFRLTPAKSTAIWSVQLNAERPPFNNIEARKAIYYATNAKKLDDEFFGGRATMSESFTGPGGLFYEPKVPGFPTYNLAKARALVKKLGGLSVTMSVVAIQPNETLAQGVQGEWAAAGISVKIDDNPLPVNLQNFSTHNWEAALNTMGSYDPATGLGINIRMLSNGPYSGVSNPVMDKLLKQGETVVSPAARKRIYAQAAKLIARDAYAPYLFARESFTASAKSVQGPGITSSLPAVEAVPEIHWEDVSLRH